MTNPSDTADESGGAADAESTDVASDDHPWTSSFLSRDRVSWARVIGLTAVLVAALNGPCLVGNVREDDWRYWIWGTITWGGVSLGALIVVFAMVLDRREGANSTSETLTGFVGATLTVGGAWGWWKAPHYSTGLVLLLMGVPLLVWVAASRGNRLRRVLPRPVQLPKRES